MKFSSIFATFSAVAAQESRGIKPPGRLEKTTGNFKKWLSQNIIDADAIDRWSIRVDKMTANMLSAYGRANCGFYDSSLTNGGPDPNPDLRPNGKPRKVFERKRRQGLTQITKQFRVWSERHINECGGQRRFNHIARRMDKWTSKLGNRWENQF
ncbi:Oidioi.mRNA.OKI2018_I69.chr2.g6798.t1.cds [Oikopleura dioica]|uniref:Oidioi.mRNA.OKI2018_I69.chr2.g6798.t1.cds n=1 Tax=Oikopleura dioica TaxID=34765 RepID=A0ABN7TAQ3_OIKDI|nr:Oidioi.mRNA.OKI2018_I69.chr2.g6798.t1.cds [Oikopleura dioica]